MTAFGAKLAAARAAGALSRKTGRGGTSLPGRLLMRLEPNAIGLLANGLREGSVVVSATNGKTTTSAMIAAILEATGRDLVHNRAGANMAGGVASALLHAADADGTVDADMGLFEVDEFWLPQVAGELKPRALLLSNLFRDQLDRYGELETIADRWAAVVGRQEGRLVLNADDPLVADLGLEARNPLFFGVEDTSIALPGLQHASDSKHCRRCGAPYVYDAVLLGHLGHYHCPNGDSKRPIPAVSAGDVELIGVRGAAFTLRGPTGEARVELPLPGLYNVYNALAAAALCTALGVPIATIAGALGTVAPAFGRAEQIDLEGQPMTLLLVKNPAGANEVLRTLSLEDGDLDLLGVLNDRTADGRDVSWVWDADFEVIASRVRRVTCSGTRAAELAVRFKYAGVDPERITVVDDLPEAIETARADGDGPLYALPTYTAMLDLRQVLHGRALA